ncbi:MAG TPA: DUF4395 family protein [Candidatus Acidoferrales bacterium]|jgi:hypothetical protein|nr:DUF4395 family protein [Candidatus Acidoferrales bacterium]
MGSQAIRNFMKQQGFADEASALCDMHFAGLYFQPRIVGSLIVVGIALNLAGYRMGEAAPIHWAMALFFALSVVLWWNVIAPSLNPFEVVYNRAFALPKGRSPLVPAPGPRRFAQAIAAAFTLIVGISLLQGWNVTAWVFEAFLVAAFSMLLFGKFCLGAYIFLLLRGQFSLANSTLPWARS